MSQRRQVLGGRDKSNNTPEGNPRTRARRIVMKLRTGASTAAVARLLRPSACFVLLSQTSLPCVDQTRLFCGGQRHRAISPVRPVAPIPIRT